MGIYSQKGGRRETHFRLQNKSIFKYYYKKEKKKKICKVQHVKGANENNKNGNVAFRTSCGLIIRLFED